MVALVEVVAAVMRGVAGTGDSVPLSFTWGNIIVIVSRGPRTRVDLLSWAEESEEAVTDCEELLLELLVDEAVQERVGAGGGHPQHVEQGEQQELRLCKTKQ